MAGRPEQTFDERFEVLAQRFSEEGRIAELDSTIKAKIRSTFCMIKKEIDALKESPYRGFFTFGPEEAKRKIGNTLRFLETLFPADPVPASNQIAEAFFAPESPRAEVPDGYSQVGDYGYKYTGLMSDGEEAYLRVQSQGSR